MADDEKKKTDEKPKIIVDDDWKAEAQAEKERLAREAEKERASQPPKGAGGPRQLPPASFSSLVNMLATQTMMALGGMQDPKTKRVLVDLELGKHHVDTLEVLVEKTKGNLADDEEKMLDEALYHTRMLYVQMTQRLAGGGQEGATSPQGDQPQQNDEQKDKQDGKSEGEGA